MDSNGTQFVLLNSPAEFRTASRDCGWNAQAQAFTLTQRDQPRIPRLDAARIQQLWEQATPYILDDHGQIGRLSDDRRQFEWALQWPSSHWEVVRAAHEDSQAADAAALTLDPVAAPDSCVFTDLHLGGSGRVALPYSDNGTTHGLLLVHLRSRWQQRCSLPFAPRRAWVDHDDNIWIAGDTELALCRGGPLPQAYLARSDRFEPAQLNPDPLRIVWQQALPEHTGLVALAADEHRLLLLVNAPDAPQRQQLLSRPCSMQADAPYTRYALPGELPRASDIALSAPDQLLLLTPLEEGAQRTARRDCPAVLLSRSATGAAQATLLAERWPRSSEAGVRFVRHRDNRVRTLTESGIQPLYRLAQTRYPQQATAVLTLPLDSADVGTLWHRLYIDACIPPGCSIAIAAQAFEVWSERPAEWDMQPQPGRLPFTSELPYADGAGATRGDHDGLYEVLLQRRNGAVRDLAGRYLRLRITLSGDGRHSPAIYALRAWYPRPSWQVSFLPRHFHQQQAPVAMTPEFREAANGADLRERMLACFEGVMTPLEERIAAAETLLYPDATPTQFLPWLAGMTATRLPQHWPEYRQRRWLNQHGQLQRQRGSFAGLCRALDIVSDGGVRRGEVIPVELFRLRRTLSTILGISMDDARHPLTLGTGQSGNSIVGESLILADDVAQEFLALFAPELAGGVQEQRTVARFFDKYARRVTIVLHGSARQQRRLISEALPGLIPAAVQWTIQETEQPFVLGLSPLLNIDTYLEPESAPGRVQLDRSRLGRGHLLHNPVALSPEHATPSASDYQGGDRP